MNRLIIPYPYPIDLAEEKRKKDLLETIVYVDTEGKPWLKDKDGKFYRIRIERKPS